MLLLWTGRTHCKKLSGKLICVAITGQDSGTPQKDEVNGPHLIGRPTETIVINNIETQALLGIGSCISSVGQFNLCEPFEPHASFVNYRHTKW